MSPSVVPTRDDLVARLRVRFADVPAENVRRCVDDLWCCCAHLGVRPEERIIERLAASRLTGVVRGGRPPYPDARPASSPPGSHASAARAAAPPLRRAGLPPAGPADLSAPRRSARAATRTPIGM
ncbi:hypothetical protein [Actinomadura chibensis]|uniref:Uncharacterized protein n=1 Tax=Actinomadura chibensis TaxID=392828 RepID=A0A5D0ND61_9ACTN|nr:hypothetical protein [Actinomadura chibensis]TYB42155.1 hypothetical protein FXF69_30470 [Actinomadura chibensis]